MNQIKFIKILLGYVVLFAVSASGYSVQSISSIEVEWKAFGNVYHNSANTRNYNGKKYIYVTSKEANSGLYKSFITEIGKTYKVSAILLGADINRNEDFVANSYMTVSSALPTASGENIIASSSMVTGGVAESKKFEFIATSTISYIGLRSDTAWKYANFRDILVAKTGEGANAYNGAPVSLPGSVEAEYYDKGGEGSAYHDLDSENHGGAIRNDEGVDIEVTSDGYNVGWMRNGEYLTYSVDVQEDSDYDIEVRVATAVDNGKLKVSLDKNNASVTFDIPNTSNWQNWTTVKKTLSLKKGFQLLRLDVIAKKFNVDKITFTKSIVIADTTAPVIALNGENSIVLTVGENYTDAGATATDDVDGAINLEVNNPVNTNTAGTYTVTYTATDATGNSATLTRTVEVHSKLTNEIHISNSDVVYSNLQEAIDNASDGATVTLENGLYKAGITVNKNNLTIKNVNGADNVVISGAEAVTGWQYDDSLELYYASVPDSCTDVQMLFVNNVEKKASRYPRDAKTYLTVNDATGNKKSRFSLKGFNVDKNFINNSMAHIRTNAYKLSSRRVTDFNNGYIQLISDVISDGDGNITSEFKVFFTQVIGAIDEEHEWAVNDNKIYIKSDNEPQAITVACSKYGIYLDKKAKNITISGVHITKISGNGIENIGHERKRVNDDLIIKNNTISYVTGWGIHIADFYKNDKLLPADTILQGNEIHHTRTGGIFIFADNALIDSNTIHDIGASKLDDDVLSYGGESNMLSGIYVKNSSGAKISNNRIDKVGYNGISLSNGWSRSVSNGDRIVENNYVSNAMLSLNDGGCIYTYTSKKLDIEKGVEPKRDIIRNNIVENCKGSYVGINETSNFHKHSGDGIYLDNDSSYTDIYGNIVMGATKSLFLNSRTHNVSVTNNNLISPYGKSIYIREINGKNKENVFINNNKVLSGDKWTYQLILNSGIEGLLMEINSNNFRVNSKVQVKHGYGYDVDTNSFNIWKGNGYDVDSIVIKDSTKPVVLINPSLNQKTFSNLEGCRKFDNSPLNSSSVNVGSYASLVLFGCTNYTPNTYKESK